MFNWNSPWRTSSLPQPPAGGTSDVLWGWGSVLEAQTRLWNHALDANRSFWSLYMPWLQTAPLVWNAAIAPGDPERRGTEPARTVDGVPDALESQMRSWNHFLDANRSFWSAFADAQTSPEPAKKVSKAAPSHKTARSASANGRASRSR